MANARRRVDAHRVASREMAALVLDGDSILSFR
jgi:hypothetical protein